ncbi:MAG: sulfite exporter TauE/SafE family protein [Spirochaetota bacterium]|nr:sulfite exporter TauE/SafE family protein [Spirochaetota bacterium]
MSQELLILIVTALSIGFFHTLLGPDHYIPFIMMARARRWSLSKTSWITFLCGLGHIGSSILLGFIGIIFGMAVSKLEAFESFRGNIAAWLLIIFGLLYFIWGLQKAYKNKPHKHLHSHGDGDIHEHTHIHSEEHVHVHDENKAHNLTPWILFTIFLFGPCEPLIPILMYPAAKSNIFDLIIVTSVFGGVTIITMMSIVLFSCFGINFFPIGKLERYAHPIAGFSIFLCGMGIQFLGL